MKKQTVALDEGRQIEIREMLWSEAKRVREDGDKLPMEWPLEEQFKGREQELAGLGVSEIRKAAEAVYALTFATAAAAEAGKANG